MGTEIRKSLTFVEGARTTPLDVTSEPVWIAMDDAMIDRVACQRRLGKSRLYKFSAVSTIVDFDGSDDRIALNLTTSSVPTFGTRLTVKLLFVVDDISSDRFVIGRNAAATAWFTVKQTTTETVVATVADSGGTTTSLTWTGIEAGTKCALMVVRDGASLTGYLNGTTQTGSMSASNNFGTGVASLGSDNGGSFLNGAIDHLTILSTAETSQRDGWCRHMNPRAENVIADWIVTLSGTRVLDRGPYAAHLTATGSPASNRTPLALNPEPVMAIGSNLDRSGRAKTYCVVGDRVYPVTF